MLVNPKGRADNISALTFYKISNSILALKRSPSVIILKEPPQASV